MIRWCKCIKYFTVKWNNQNIECFVGEKYRYKKVGDNYHFIDIDHPYYKNEGWPVPDIAFDKNFIDVSDIIRDQNIDYILN